MNIRRICLIVISTLVLILLVRTIKDMADSWSYNKIETMPERVDYVAHRFPSLFEQAKIILGDMPTDAIEEKYENPWMKRVVVSFGYEPKHKNVVFVQKGYKFYRLNCKEGLPYVSKILEEYPFSKADFNSAHKTEEFLDLLVYFYSEDIPNAILTSEILQQDKKFIEMYASKDPNLINIFTSLCTNLIFEFDRNVWNISFNLLHGDGRVERWDVTGEFIPFKQANKIIKINVSIIKNAGTFGFPYIG